jgi:hypothetical protein
MTAESQPGADDFQQILQERDPFRMAIRGFAAIEAEIDDAILEAFTGDLPRRGVRQLGGFSTRLTLAIALGIVSKEFRPIIDSLARLRNDLAHGKVSDITPQRQRALAKVVRELLPARDGDTTELETILNSASPRVALMTALIFARAVVQTGVQSARQRRAQPPQGSRVAMALAAGLRELPQQESGD